MKLHKKILTYLILALCISMFSVPTFASKKDVTITIQKVSGKKVQKTYKFTVARGQKPTKKQIKTAKEKAIKWLGSKKYNTNKKIYSTNLTQALDKKFYKNTKINVKYTQHTYKIVFKSGGGTGTMATKTVKYKDKVKLTNAFSKKYYVFDHWAASNGKTYSNGATVSRLTSTDKGTVTLTAVFRIANKDQTYKITYNLDGGENSTRNPYTYTYKKGFILKAPVRKSWVFEGWTGTGIPYVTKTVKVPHGSVGDRNYTAHWKAVKYAVKFDTNGGKNRNNGKSAIFNSITKTSGEKFQLPKVDFVKERLKFKEWKDKNGHTYKDGQWVKDILLGAGNVDEVLSVKLTAVWEDDPYADVKLTINPNGGEYEGNSSKNQGKYSYNGNTIKLQKAKKDGYTFVKWECTGGGHLDKTSMYYTYGSKDGTVKAIYKKNK